MALLPAVQCEAERGCYGHDVPSDFRALSLSPSLLAVVAEVGYTAPTPIQEKCIPPLLARKDLIGQSKTGSGKTAAFALPVLQNLSASRRVLQVIVACPTRELAAQVARELRRLGRRHSGLQVLLVVGGEPVRVQRRALEKGVHIVVGTPGRLLDHLRRGVLNTADVSTVILDEADRMLDMGFQPDVEEILAAVPKSRQTVFFSATFPASMGAMSHAHQRDPVRVTIEESQPGAAHIRQLALSVRPEQRLQALYSILSEQAHSSVLVFSNFKRTVAELSASLHSSGASVQGLTSDLAQFEREQVLARFRNQSLRILVATDVAGRGIDIDHLDLVINYELPSQASAYVHRIGRTGRAGRDGVAVSLVTSREERLLSDIERLTGTSIQRLPDLPSRKPDLRALAKGFAIAAAMDTVLISGGRKDKVRPGDVLGALTGEAGGLSAEDIGKIEIHDRISYVAVAAHLSDAAVKSLSRGRIKGRRFRATLIGRIGDGG